MDERRRLVLVALNEKYSHTLRRNPYFNRRRPEGLGNEEYLPKTEAQMTEEVCTTTVIDSDGNSSLRALTFGEVVDTVLAVINSINSSTLNETTIAALREVREGNLPRVDNLEAFYDELNREEES